MGIKQAQAYFAALISWPLAAQDYNPTAIPPQIIGSPQTMTPLNGGDDSTRLVQFAFPFEYYGQTYTQAWVSTNGFVSFNNVGHLCCDGQPIETAPRNTIYGLWTDLISNGNPYYRSDATATIFGWYNTQEFGSWQPNTFEIALFPDGKVQLNYGDVTNLYHNVTAGLTGPTMADSISLFYGQNVNLLDNTSYIAGVPSSPPPPEPEPVFNPVDVAPSVAPNPVEDTVAEVMQQEILEDQPVVETVVEDTAEEAAAETEVMAEATEEVVEEVVETVEEEAATEEVVVEEEQEAEAEDAERLDPNEVLALAAGGGEVSDGSSELTQSEISSSLEAVSESAAQAESAESNEAKAEEAKSSAAAASQDKNQTTEVGSTEVRRVEDRDGPLDASKTDPEASQVIASTSSTLSDTIQENGPVEPLTGASEAREVLVETASASVDATDKPVEAVNRSDNNVLVFQQEAVADADTFERETILQVRLQDVEFVANADAQYELMHGAQTTTDTVDTTYELTNIDGPVFAPPPVTGMVSEPTSPSSQAQQMELLNMAGMQGEMAAGSVIDIGDVNSGDNEAMTQLAVAPVGYSAYTQARIPDQPFYQPRDIYKGRRIPDASMALYRMMRGQDQLWDDMMEDQYE